MRMSLVIMKEEKYRKHTTRCESRFNSDGIFLNTFREIWIISVGGGHQRAQHSVPWRLYCTRYTRDQSVFLLWPDKIVYQSSGERVLVINMNSGLRLQGGINRGQYGSRYFRVPVWAEVLAGWPSFLPTHAISLSGPFLCSLQNPPAKTNTPLPGRP